MGFRDLIDFNDLSIKEWDELYSMAMDIMKNPKQYIDSCQGKILGTLFFEPSTRTMFSFQTAMLRLGGKIIGFSDPQSSSVSKGEDLQDTIKTMGCYSDLIAMRHPLEGASKAASIYSSVPVINAGDGGHLHPTQTMTDITTIMTEKGALDGLTIGICGDLKNGRTVHSLLKALSRYENNKFILISPENLRTPSYLTEMLKRKNISYTEVQGLDEYIEELDILYMTRMQRERFLDLSEYEKIKGLYILNSKKMENAKKDMLVMHPMPRVDEISHEIDSDPRAAYFKQARYGLFARMALILKMLASPFDGDEEIGISGGGFFCNNPKCITNHEHYLKELYLPLRHAPGMRYCVYCEKQYESGDL